MAKEWQVARPGQPVGGPYAAHELRKLVASGELLPSDLVWKPGMRRWMPASQLTGLFDAQEPEGTELPQGTLEADWRTEAPPVTPTARVESEPAPTLPTAFDRPRYRQNRALGYLVLALIGVAAAGGAVAWYFGKTNPLEWLHVESVPSTATRRDAEDNGGPVGHRLMVELAGHEFWQAKCTAGDVKRIARLICAQKDDAVVFVTDHMETNVSTDFLYNQMLRELERERRTDVISDIQLRQLVKKGNVWIDMRRFQKRPSEHEVLRLLKDAMDRDAFRPAIEEDVFEEQSKQLKKLAEEAGKVKPPPPQPKPDGRLDLPAIRDRHR
jgi:hypothetical protein